MTTADKITHLRLSGVLFRDMRIAASVLRIRPSEFARAAIGEKILATRALQAASRRPAPRGDE